MARKGSPVTDENNFLTMKTTDGSASLLDGGINASAKFGRKLLVGAQVYTRNIGNLGNGGVTVDWAQAITASRSGWACAAARSRP